MDERRVLFVAHSYPRAIGDAAGSFLWHLAVALAGQGIRVRVVAPSAPGFPADDDLGGIPVHRFRYAPASWETLAYTGNMAADVRGSWRGRAAMTGLLGAGIAAAWRCCRTFRPHVVHAHWWFPGGVIGAAVSTMTGIPLLVTMHGSDVRLARSTPLSHGMLRRVLARARATTTVSTWLAREVSAMAPGIVPRVEPMPVATDLFAPGVGPRQPRILFVGRLNRQKGIADVVEAMPLLPAHLCLDVVGDGPDGASLRDRACALGVEDRIRWLGAVPQPSLVPLYQRAAAVVVPSVDEGLGLVAVEAQLCATPVVGYASGGTVDTVRHGETGLLVPVGDHTALAAALASLAADPECAARMGAEGRRSALERFSPQAVAARYASLYEASQSR